VTNPLSPTTFLTSAIEELQAGMARFRQLAELHPSDPDALHYTHVNGLAGEIADKFRVFGKEINNVADTVDPTTNHVAFAPIYSTLLRDLGAHVTSLGERMEEAHHALRIAQPELVANAEGDVAGGHVYNAR
jgi:hypothetical protein